VQGQAEEARGENFKFSSCDRDHYYLRSNRLEFYRTPGGEPAKIVLRQNALFVLGRRVVPLPVYVISLLGQRSRRQPLQTTAGQNAIDGFFVRTLTICARTKIAAIPFWPTCYKNAELAWEFSANFWRADCFIFTR
jgi:hypothetical protein